MKKLLLLMAFVLPMLASCSKDDDNDLVTVSDIVGTWKLVQYSNTNGNYMAWPFQTTTATFNANGTYSGSGYFGNGDGTWRQSGNIITTYIEGQEYIKYEVIELSKNSCTLKMYATSDSSLYIKCTKISETEKIDTPVTQSELEAVTSYEYHGDGSTLYITFKDGYIYTEEISEIGSYNHDKIKYTLNGSKITFSISSQSGEGTIYQSADGNYLKINFNGTYGVATWLSKTFEKSNYVINWYN